MLHVTIPAGQTPGAPPKASKDVTFGANVRILVLQVLAEVVDELAVWKETLWILPRLGIRIIDEGEIDKNRTESEGKVIPYIRRPLELIKTYL